MPLLSAESRDVVALSAVCGVVLASLVSWRIWRWIGHTRAPEVQSSAQPTNRATRQHEQHDGTVHSEQEHSTAGKRLSAVPHEHHHHHHHHHHKHTKALSSRSQGSQSPHDHDKHGETEHLLNPRAQTQPNYSGTSHHSHAHQADSLHSSQILPFHDTHDEPASMSHGHHVEGTDFVGKKHSGSGHTSSHNGSSLHHQRDSDSRSSSNTPERIPSGDDLGEGLRKYIITYLELHPEDSDEWEEGNLHFTPGIDVPGKRYRDLALREARLRKDAFDNSKKAFKMGRKAEAKQLSDEGKLHDENARRYNMLAASDIFAANNPQYYSGRRLSKCDLHGLHVEEAMSYAKDHLIACRTAGADKTMLIVGKGSHSQQGGSRIKPAILSMLSETGGVVAGVHEKNQGCIVVEFAIGHYR